MVAQFDLDQFVDQPTQAALDKDKCHKNDLICITSHYGTSVPQQASRRDIKALVVEKLVELEVVDLSVLDDLETDTPPAQPGVVYPVAGEIVYWWLPLLTRINTVLYLKCCSYYWLSGNFPHYDIYLLTIIREPYLKKIKCQECNQFILGNSSLVSPYLK